MGILGQHRTVNCACFLFVLFWFVHLFVWIKKYAASEFFQRINSYVVTNQKVVIGMALVAFIVQGNFAQVCSDLIKGKASGYHNEMLNRYQKIKECKNTNEVSCSLDSLRNKPKSLFNLDISEDENNWINKGEAAYFEMDHIYLK
jgi:hypothetical protein